MMNLCSQILFLVLTVSLITGLFSSAAFTFVNNCTITVWPGILSTTSSLSTTGFALQTGNSRTINATSSWVGRFWGRTHCSTNSSGQFTCLTGDCLSGKIDCAGAGGATPATLAEFALDGYAGKDFYDVSLVDGYNLPMLVVPQGGQNCSSTGCVRDLNDMCPSQLRVTGDDGKNVGCMSACRAFGSDEYCCRQEYGTQDKCRPTQYAQAIKSAYPSAYSYSFDDTGSTFTCSGADYIITFCPSQNTSQTAATGGQTRSSPAGGQAPSSPTGRQTPRSGSNNTPRDGNLIYEGASDVSASPSTCSHVFGASIVVVAAAWRLL